MTSPRLLWVLGLTAAISSASGHAAEPLPAAVPLPPTHADVAYGPNRRQVLDVWLAPSRALTPVMIYFHGGAWTGGTKATVLGLREALAAGVSVVSVEYRLLGQAEAAGIQPPVRWPMEDARRALQFVRSKAAAWHLDPTRVCTAGNSAGGTMALWLALHDDLADPASDDPVARASTRVVCAATTSPQTSLDPVQMRTWIPNIDYGARAFGIAADRSGRTTRFERFLAERERVLPWIREYSPWELVTADDPPVYMSFVTRPAMGTPQAAGARAAAQQRATANGALSPCVRSQMRTAGQANPAPAPRQKVFTGL